MPLPPEIATCGLPGSPGDSDGGDDLPGGSSGSFAAALTLGPRLRGTQGGGGGTSDGATSCSVSLPCASKPPAASAHPVRYANGAVLLSEADITVPQGGFFSHVRHYCNQASDSYDGPNGFNWWVRSMACIVASGTSVAVVFDPNNPYWFDLSGSDYVPRYGVVGVTLVEDTMAQTLTFTRTVNGRLQATVFNDLTVWPNPGGLVTHTGSGGIVTTPTIATDGTTSELQRPFTSGGSTITESLLYGYFSSGTAVGKLQTVTLRRKVGSGAWDPVEQALYGYCGASDPNGNLNDLKTVSKQLPDGSGGWNTVAVKNYRWYLGTETTGIAHGLKMHFGPESCRLMLNAGIDLDTASDAVV